MNINKKFVKNGDKIAEKLILAIEKDTKIISSGSLSYSAIANNLPAICNTIIKAISNNNLSLLALWEEDRVTSCTPEELVIESDYLRLQQIITNLLTNAVRYTAVGEIKLSCCIKEPNLLEITVSDTGIGIAEDDRDCIFEPYFRSQKSQENVLEGVGLGLAIVSQLVNMLRGKIELISQISIGSTFIVTIPLNL